MKGVIAVISLDIPIFLKQVEESDTLVHVEYSYWTLCYVITLQGAKKLLDGQPLGKMVPVDEYIPIMFNKHPKVKICSIFVNYSESVRHLRKSILNLSEENIC